jgi:hypothetical protein
MTNHCSTLGEVPFIIRTWFAMLGVVKYAARFERYMVESILHIASAQNSPAVHCRAKHKILK